MSLGLGKKDSSGKLHMPQTLSPLQATHLLLSVIDVKFIVPKYQVTPAEWEAAHQAEIENTGAPTATSSNPTVRTNHNPRSYELVQGVNEALAYITDADAISLAETTLKRLGVN